MRCGSWQRGCFLWEIEDGGRVSRVLRKDISATVTLWRSMTANG